MAEITIFSDASVDYNQMKAGIGFVIEKEGEEVARKSTEIDYCSSVKAEWKALITALQTVDEQYSIENVKAYTDCHSISAIINGKGEPKSDMTQGMLWKYKNIAREFNMVDVYYINRCNNTTADSLAKLSHQ